MPLEPILYALAAAALLTALGWRPWRPWRGGEAPRSGPVAAALLGPATFAAAWYGYRAELVPLPPTEALHWSFVGGLLGVPLGLLPARPGWRAALGRGLVALALAVPVVHGAAGRVLEREHGSATTWTLVGALALLLGLAHASHVALAARRGEGSGLAWLWVLGLGAAAAVQRGTFGGGGLLLGGLATGAGGLWVLGLWRPAWRLAPWAVGPWNLTAGALLLVGALLADTPVGASLVAFAVPHAAWCPGRGWAGALGRTLLAAALVGLALWLSWPEPDPYSAYR